MFLPLRGLGNVLIGWLAAIVAAIITRLAVQSSNLGSAQWRHSFIVYRLDKVTLELLSTDVSEKAQEFRFEGDRVRIRRIDQGVLLEPLIPDATNWFDELDRFDAEPFISKRRNQPITPRRKIFM